MKLKWEWEISNNIIKWIFVEIDEENKKKVIGTVVSTQIWDKHWDVEATCTEIGYDNLMQSVNQQNIRCVVLDHKKSIQEGVEKKRKLR